MKFDSPTAVAPLMVVILAAGIASHLGGCGRSDGVVQESSEYTFNDVASQIAAEEAASQQEREK